MLLEWSFALISGLTLAMAGFLVATGLTLVFGVLGILNFAHGAYFMVGAYVTYWVVGKAPQSVAWWLTGCLAGGLAVGLLGLLTDTVVFRRLRGVDQHYTLIATFALLLVVTGLVKLVFGLDFHSVQPPPGLDTTLAFGGLFIPVYSIFVIGAGVAVFVVLDLAMRRSWGGKLVQAVARDAWMADVMGINTSVVMTIAVVVSFALAGLAGGLLVPNQSLSPALGDVFLLFAFNAVILGGLGNVRGAFIASIILGIVESSSAVLLPDMPSITLYLALIAFILLKPQGLFASTTG
jgi:branched-subunit amino acid ABC-type transport system permease component